MARTAGSIGEVTERAILDSARRLITEIGFDSLSIRRLAAEAGITSGALYRYFPSKSAILFRLLHRHMSELITAWGAADPGQGGSSEARLEAFIRFHLRYHIPRREDVFLSYRELRNLSQDDYDTICVLRDRYEAVLAGLIDDAVADGSIAPRDTKLATRAIISMLTGVTEWFRDDGPLDVDALQEHYVALALHGLTGQPGA
ncbi:MAG: TetR/AcrR family transcriptional regulator [Pseudomonadota bacterium]